MWQIGRREFLKSLAAVAALPCQTQNVFAACTDPVQAAVSGASAGPYRYAVVDGGFEVVNGPGSFNRPLPPSHARDAVSRSERLVCWAGDRPQIRFTALATRATNLGELRLTVSGRHLDEFQKIHARYSDGVYQYRLTDPSLAGEVKLTAVPATRFEGLILKLELPTAAAGQVGLEFGPTNVELLDTMVRLRPSKTKRILFAGSDAKFSWTGRDSLRGTQQDKASTIYVWFTSDDPAAAEIRQFLSNPSQPMEESIRDLRATAATLHTKTPDPFLDAIVAQQSLAMDRAWHNSSVMHGVYAWHVALAGWRSLYGATVLGQHERVRSHAECYFAEQVLEPEFPPPPEENHKFGEAPACRGALPAYLGRKSYFYNMGEVLLDMVMYDWEWNGDLEFMNRAFETVERKLVWQDRCLDPDGDGLYENWLNAWNTDSKWHNGGGGIIASVYTWRASLIMADLARRLGRDPKPFQARAEKIRKACEQTLWVPAKGVFAEYKDALGLQRRHEAPDLSSIYTTIDLGFCDEFQSYQMLRFAEYSIPRETGLVRGGELMWSSNWLPPMYSTYGLYADEVVNTILCYFRLGLAEKGYTLLKGMESTALMGECPGTFPVRQNPDGSASGHIDFSDVVSVFLKTVVDGLFGVRMNVPEGIAEIQPSFPPDWKHASMRGPVATATYEGSDTSETLSVTTARKLRYRFRMPARSSHVKSVRIDGKAVDFRLEPGIGHAWVVAETSATQAAELRVEYGTAPLPRLQAPAVGATGSEFAFSVENGSILRLHDPQGVIAGQRIKGSRASVRLHGDAGWHTFFVLTQNGKAQVWLPVDFELRPALQIVDARRTQEGLVARLRNNTQSARTVSGEIRIAGVPHLVQTSVPALGSAPVSLKLAETTRLSPGTNTLRLTQSGQELAAGSLVDWKIPASGAKLFPLARHCNQELATLHQQRYVEPRTPHYTMTVQENGRSWWLNRVKLPEPRLDILRASGGLLKSAAGVPFEVVQSGSDACFTSWYRNFPRKLTIPVGQEARKLYFLLAVSTNQMQSRIENARINVRADGRLYSLPLINPENLDDWLTEPFALSGCSQPFGPGTWGRIVDLDLEERKQVESVELECLSNEVLFGLVGLTLLA